jgi:hypothetical protein
LIGHAEQHTREYIRQGTSTLFAALEIATGNNAKFIRPEARQPS